MSTSIGIDLGTTTTIVTYRNKRGRLRQLRYGGETLIPSVIYFRSPDEWIIGKAAKTQMQIHPEAGIESFKRRIGDYGNRYDVTSENGDQFRISGRQAAEKFLATLVKYFDDKVIEAANDMDATIEHAVITVPAKFSTVEKEATKRAARNAQLSSVQTVIEPTAAAVAAFGGQEEAMHDGMALLVYDFGGGTFDVSVIQRERGMFQEIATNGDKHLGGNDLTDRIVQFLIERVNDEYGTPLVMDPEELDEDEMPLDVYQRNMYAIRTVANDMKEALSDEDEVTREIGLLINGQPEQYEAHLTRQRLEGFIKNDINRTVDITLQTIEEAKENGVADINQVVLAGGSSSIPMIQRVLKERLEPRHVLSGEAASYLISPGARLLAEKADEIANLTSTITNTRLGVAVWEDIPRQFAPIIRENQKLPCSGTHRFRLGEDGQRQFKVYVAEHDVKNYPEAVRVGETGIEQIDVITIDELPPGLKKNETEIEVTFTEQMDGNLDIHVQLLGADGKPIRSEVHHINKESDVE